jgi:hypothetical protein
MAKVVTVEFDNEDDAEGFAKWLIERKFKMVKSVEMDYHTPHELYQHRYELFRALVFGTNRLRSWMSKLHADGTMFEDSFIVGMYLPTGTITYHYPLSWWDKFVGITEYEKAPEWDGTTPEEGLKILEVAVTASQDRYGRVH